MFVKKTSFEFDTLKISEFSLIYTYILSNFIVIYKKNTSTEKYGVRFKQKENRI